MNRSLTILSFILSTGAHAVTVARCPQVIRADFEISQLYDRQNIESPEEFFHDIDDAQAARDTLANTPPEALRNVELILTQTQSGRCSYSWNGLTPPPSAPFVINYETRFFTRDGRDILRVVIPLGDTEAWIYFNVTDYSTDGLRIAPVRGTRILAGFDHGSPHDTIGWMRALRLQ